VAVTSAASSSTSPPASGLAASSGASASLLSDLRCPRCGLGGILAGRRGWGCTRWRQGCSFVVWFEIEGRRLSEGELRTLIANGRSATTVARPGGAAVAGQLVLDVSAERGAVRFEPI
jgi:DNA topoisomerase-3